MEFNTNNYLNKRIEVNQSYGIIKYAGTLQHLSEEELIQSKYDPKQIWLGIEWDEVSRGKHNGTVNGYQYFQTQKNQFSGTLIKLDKANFGQHIFDALYLKYFKQIPTYQLNLDPSESLQNLRQCKIKDEQEEESAQDKQKNSNEEENNKNLTHEVKYQDTAQVISRYQNNELVKVEYDEQAFIVTQMKYRKRVEFLGFDKVWRKITNLEQLSELSLAHCQISDIGALGQLNSLMPNLKTLSLENNLLHDWHQVYQLAIEFPNLTCLSLSSNKLKDTSVNFEEEKEIRINSNKTTHPEPIIFKNLKQIILIDTNINWKTFIRIMPCFPFIEDLILCKNQLNDFQNLKIRKGIDLNNLKFLNLEQNDIDTFQPINDNFGHLNTLERLTLNINCLKNLGDVSGFQGLTAASFEQNQFFDCLFFSQLNKMSKLQSLRISHNSHLEKKYEVSYLRQRAIAEIPSLKQINGSELKKYERKDSEIYYMKKTFEDYFAYKNRPHYDYDFQDFIENYCVNHPRLPALIKIYGNPFEIDQSIQQNKEQQQNQNIYKKPATNQVQLCLILNSGQNMGQKIDKKFPQSTSIQMLKNLCSKLFKIPIDQIIFSYQIDTNSPIEYVSDGYKTLYACNFQNGQEIKVDIKE